VQNRPAEDVTIAVRCIRAARAGRRAAVNQPIAPCLWFDNQAEEAANYYVSVFKNSKIVHVDRFSDVGPDPEAPVVFVEFQINGQPFQAINGGPLFTFSEAISFSIACEDQSQVDFYWDTLIGDGGEPIDCGWLKDKYGVTWQVVPRRLHELLRDPDRERAGQVMRRMLQMKKLDIAELEAAYEA
jgi:predicted 3-demethylubiquinone-9 3-methyltransferase (glyoxalase superfamily)